MRKIISILLLSGILLSGLDSCTAKTPQQKKTRKFKSKYRSGSSMPCPTKDC